eukprot:GFUD01013905.1.p1 GENE.GFUD01013905.1~~GFUD01013905.1.p1  ORF type:complete len:920 (+),score=246.81 GFUD01013905.1:471-3230(+)
MTMSGSGSGRPTMVSSMPHGHGNVGHGHFPGTPVPMKLFATWEVERTPPNCIPRLCSLTLARLALFKTLDSDLTSIIIAVKMQSSKRTLRSNEIQLPTTGLLDTELELAFSLQYPHFLKREGNTLQIMLQRRKKYKNRTILGYKTLAVGIINMSQVLQRQMDMELELVEGKGGGGAVLGKVYMLSLSSQPVDHEDLGKQIGDTDRGLVECDSDDEEDFSSPDEGSDSEPMIEEIRNNSGRRKSAKGLSNSAARQRNLRQKFVALLRRFKVNEPEELRALKNNTEQNSQVNDVDPEEIEDLLNELEDYSDYGPDLDTTSVGSTPKPSLRPFFSSSRSLIREALDNPGTQKSGYSILEKPEIGSDHMSDDSSKGALSDSHPETLTDPEHSDHAGVTSSPPHSGDEVPIKGGKDREKPDRKSKLFNKENYKGGGTMVLDRFSQSIKAKSGSGFRDTKDKESAHGHINLNKDRLERMNSANNFEGSSPRKVLLEQLSRILPADDSLPDQVILANTGDPQASHLASKLSDTGAKVICTAGPADVRATLTCLVTRLQKYCNTNIAPPSVMKVGLCGSDSFLNSMLRPYVELFSSKPPDWQNHILFYVIPLGNNSVSKGLAARCPLYTKLFHDDSWRDLLDKPEPTKAEIAELVGRVSQYLALSYNSHLSIAEAMVTYKEKLTDEESCQVFVPFVSDVKVGAFSDNDSEDFSLSNSFGLGTNYSNPFHERKPDRLTPPSSPNISKHTFDKDFNQKQRDEELMELQLDYWGISAEKNDKLFGTKNENGDKKQDTEKSKKQADPKSSIKTQFRNLSIYHLSTSPILSHSTDYQHAFSMTYTTKEKKPKAVLKIGKKKEKSGDTDSKFQSIEGISRLICMTKSNHPLKVAIDGYEWAGVKFFQLSSQWQTHIKYLPVAVGTPSQPADQF